MTITTTSVARGEIDHELIWGWVALVSAAIAAWFITTVGVPRVVCPFRAVTGLPCLTCGATRALAALLHADPAGSLRLNPLVVPGAGLACVYVPYALLVAHAQLPRVRVKLTARDWVWVRVVATVSAAAVWTFLIVDGR